MKINIMNQHVSSFDFFYSMHNWNHALNWETYEHAHIMKAFSNELNLLVFTSTLLEMESSRAISNLHFNYELDLIVNSKSSLVPQLNHSSFMYLYFYLANSFSSTSSPFKLEVLSLIKNQFLKKKKSCDETFCYL